MGAAVQRCARLGPNKRWRLEGLGYLAGCGRGGWQEEAGSTGRVGCAVLAVPAGEGGRRRRSEPCGQSGKETPPCVRVLEPPRPPRLRGLQREPCGAGRPLPPASPRRSLRDPTGRRWRRAAAAAAAAAPRGPAGTAAPRESSSSLSSTSCGRVSDPALCRPGPARGRARRARGAGGRGAGAGPRGRGGSRGGSREVGARREGEVRKFSERSRGRSGWRRTAGPAGRQLTACWHWSARMPPGPWPRTGDTAVAASRVG